MAAPVKLDSVAEVHTLLFNLMSDGVLIVDRDGKIVDCNAAFHERLGYEKVDLIGKSVVELDPPEFAARVSERLDWIAREGQAVFETAHYRSDGSIMPVELNARLIEIAGTAYVISIVRDITERKAMDRALRDKERIYRAVVETSADGFWAADATGRIIEVNDAYLRRSGYLREEILQLHIADLEGQESPEETRAHIQKVIRDGHDRFESYHRTKSGEVWPVEIVTTYWPIDGGVLLVFNVDITERKKAEQAIEASQRELKKLSQALEQAGEGVIITDPSGIVEYVNPAFTRITGYTADEAIGRSIPILNSDPSDPAIDQTLWQAMRQGEAWEGTLTESRKDGSLFPVMISMAPVTNERGEIVHFVAIQKDLTEFRRMEEQLLHAQKMQAVGALVGGIAHDFNNMLTAVQGNVFLAECELDDRWSVAEKLRTIGEVSEKAALVVKQLLTFAKRDLVQMEPVVLNDLIVEGFRLAKSTIPENIAHRLRVCDEILAANVDSTQLQQAMINLSNNARDAVADSDRPEIEWSLQRYEATEAFALKHPHARGRSFGRITVRDNGHGIRAAHLQVIFDPFFTTKEIGRGTGLGLAMVYGSVERHGGILEVESELGRGSAFHIYLPLVQPGAAKRRGAARAAPSGKGEHILLVDDDESLRRVTARVLDKLGYSVLEAADGLQALALYRSHAPGIDLVLTDVIMPEMGGVELTRRLRGQGSGVPVILATGYDRDEVTESGLQLDRTQIVTKPFRYDRLGALIRRMLGDGE